MDISISNLGNPFAGLVPELVNPLLLDLFASELLSRTPKKSFESELALDQTWDESLRLLEERQRQE